MISFFQSIFLLHSVISSCVQTESRILTRCDALLLQLTEFEVKLPDSCKTAGGDGIRFNWIGEDHPFEEAACKPPFTLIGNFEVPFRFRVEKTGAPDRGYGSGVLVRPEFDDYTRSGVAIKCQPQTNGDQVISIDDTNYVQGVHNVSSIKIDSIGKCYGFRVRRRDRALDIYSINQAGEEKPALSIMVSIAPVLSLSFHLQIGNAVADLDVVLDRLIIECDGILSSREYQKQYGTDHRLIASSQNCLLLVVTLLRLTLN